MAAGTREEMMGLQIHSNYSLIKIEHCLRLEIILQYACNILAFKNAHLSK